MKKLVFLLLLCLPILGGCEFNKYVKFYSPGYTPAYQKQSLMNQAQQQANSQSPATETSADPDEA